MGYSPAHIPQLSFENGLAFQANDAGNAAHISLRYPFPKIQRPCDSERRFSHPSGNRQLLVLLQQIEMPNQSGVRERKSYRCN
jgi:hypothetical protein